MSQKDDIKRIGTRVFKKTSPNGKITVYLGKRDFVDHITHVDPIDGVVLVDPDYMKDNKVFAHITAAFRYGREELDVLGLILRRNIHISSHQIYPPLFEMRKRPRTRLQERLIKKLGPNAFPFYFELPSSCPASVTLQPAPGDNGRQCGIDYELKTCIAEIYNEKIQKRNCVRLSLRKITYAPIKQREQPSVEVSKQFVMSPNKLHLEASLDKELYHHGEDIAVNVHIANNSNRSAKKIKVSVRQFSEILLFSLSQYKCTVAEIQSEDGFPISPGFTLSKVYHLRPVLSDIKYKHGLALDGQLKHEDTNLASSTMMSDSLIRENHGIIVQYKVKVKLCLGPLGGDVVAELPFVLMHRRPGDEKKFLDTSTEGDTHTNHASSDENKQDLIKDFNLIQLDTEPTEDDIIFEDFARTRLKAEPEAQSN